MTEGHKFRRCCTYLSTSASMKVLGKQTIAAAAHPLEVRRLALQQRRSLGQTTKAVDCGALSPLSPRTFTRIDMRVKHLRVHLSIESTVMPEASVNVRNHTVYLNIYRLLPSRTRLKFKESHELPTDIFFDRIRYNISLLMCHVSSLSPLSKFFILTISLESNIEHDTLRIAGSFHISLTP